MSRSRPLAVYVIGSDGGPQKIGITDNIESRLTTLQVGITERLRVVHYRERNQGDARLVERAAHMLLSAKRQKGEWFNISLEEAIDGVGEAVRMVDAGKIKAPKPRPPQENVIGVRFSPEAHEALERLARADERSMSALIRKIVEDWLRMKGLLLK